MIPRGFLGLAAPGAAEESFFFLRAQEEEEKKNGDVLQGEGRGE